MDADKYNRSVSLLCPTCGSSLFEQDDENDETALVTCSSCGLETTREELIHANGESIDEHLKEMKEEVVRDLEKELKATLKKAFSGNKYIKIR